MWKQVNANAKLVRMGQTYLIENRWATCVYLLSRSAIKLLDKNLNIFK